MVPRPQTSIPGGLRPPRLRLSRRQGGFVGGLAVLIGFVLLIDAIITVVWEDPFTTIFTQREQKALGKKLSAAERAALPPSTLELVKRAGSESERMAVLAAHERTVAIAGHRTTYAAPFRRLGKLRRGYAITLTMPYGRFTYSVEGSRAVPPTQTTVLGYARYDRLVLTTCTPMGSADKRLVVTARLRTARPRGAAIRLVPIPPRPPGWTSGVRAQSG